MNFPNFNIRSQLVNDAFCGLKPHPVKCQATYVWIDGTGEFLRSKTRTLSEVPPWRTETRSYPIWNYDGSSTGQAFGHKSDIFLYPVAVFADPFLGGHNQLVLCETFVHTKESNTKRPTATNHRFECNQIMEKCAAEKPLFGMEQEYMLLDRDRHPLGWPKQGVPAPQGPYYCGVGTDKVFGREVIETHYRACLHANIEIGGTNAEVAPGQWEFQIGPCEGIAMGDHLWMARYLLHRTAERFGVIATLDPKPAITMKGDWNGAGCHTNFSTAAMRDEGGIKVIEAAMKKLALKHKEHLAVYDPHNGEDNLRRLSGKHETSSVERFTWDVANRSCSARIPHQVAVEGKGYFEDRRPASNCDPYSVMGIIAKTVLFSDVVDACNVDNNGNGACRKNVGENE